MDAGKIYEDGTYLRNNPGWHEEDSAWKAAQIKRILARNGVSPATVGEAGCGSGGILSHLADECGSGVELSGYEVSSQAFGICRKKERENLHFYLKDLLEEEGVMFDVVMAIDVLEHVEDYYGFLRRFRGKGSYKVFHIPLDLSVQSVLRRSRIMKDRTAAGHIHYFTRETALAALKDTGYEIVDCFYTSASMELPGRGWKAGLMKLPRRLGYKMSPDLTARVLGGFSLLILAR